MDLIRMLSDRLVAMNYGQQSPRERPAEVLAHPEVLRPIWGRRMDRDDKSLLSVRGIKAGYGPIRALRGDSPGSAPTGETVAVVGANGAGKTSLDAAISVSCRWRRRGRFDGHVGCRPAHQLARDRACCTCPEGRGTCRPHGVGKHPLSGRSGRPTCPSSRRWSRCIARFPRLAERSLQLAGTLSGGEQQMLAVARAIANPPRLLLIDEPSIGLSPIMIAEAYKALRQFQADGMTILLVEQNVHGACASPSGPISSSRARSSRTAPARGCWPIPTC